MKSVAFHQLVVLDFEATCDQSKPPRPQEIIEYPSVLVSLDKHRVVDEFHSFVRPQHHPQLTSFCRNLTGISQEDVDHAPPFREVFERNLEWLRSHGLRVTEGDGGVDFAFVICGDWDLAVMLPGQCRACRPPLVAVPSVFRRWINLKTVFQHKTGEEKKRGMAGMLRALGMDLHGRHHCGIDDCRNIARIVLRLADDGATFELPTGGPVR